VANFILARAGFSGQATTDTIPVAALKNQVAAFFTVPCRVPFEHLLWAFAFGTYTSDRVINGTEAQAWKSLSKQRGFKTFRTCTSDILTRRSEYRFVFS
jgi:predicted RNase H-like nuclease